MFLVSREDKRVSLQHTFFDFCIKSGIMHRLLFLLFSRLILAELIPSSV